MKQPIIKGSLTHLHAESWRDTGREDHLLPVLRVWSSGRQPEGGTQGVRSRGKHLHFRRRHQQQQPPHEVCENSHSTGVSHIQILTTYFKP